MKWSAMLEAKRSRLCDAALLATSGLFDRKYYEGNNPDVPKGCMASLKHFLKHGGQEGRSPSPHFDSEFYLRQYPDVKSAGINPVLHFVRFGRREDRFPTRLARRLEGERTAERGHY